MVRSQRLHRPLRPRIPSFHHLSHPGSTSRGMIQVLGRSIKDRTSPTSHTRAPSLSSSSSSRSPLRNSTRSLQVPIALQATWRWEVVLKAVLQPTSLAITTLVHHTTFPLERKMMLSHYRHSIKDKIIKKGLPRACELQSTRLIKGHPRWDIRLSKLPVTAASPNSNHLQLSRGLRATLSPTSMTIIEIAISMTDSIRNLTMLSNRELLAGATRSSSQMVATTSSQGLPSRHSL